MLYLFPERLEKTASGKTALRWREGEQPFAAGAQPLEFNSALHEITVMPAVLTQDECGRIRQLGDARPDSTAKLERSHATQYRTSTIAWIEPDPDAQWLYHRLGMLFLQANQRYRFTLTGFVEALQYTVYGPGDNFDWHIDLGPESVSGRKLSVSILLSSTDDYGGGELQFLSAPRSGASLPAGSAVFFPSYMSHRVAAVTQGVRRSLVAWGYGPAFR